MFTSHSATLIENILPLLLLLLVVVLVLVLAQVVLVLVALVPVVLVLVLIVPELYSLFRIRGLQKCKSDNARITTSVLPGKSKSLTTVMMMKKLAISL